MRILYLGNVQGFENASKYYLTPQKLVNGFTRLGHVVYCFSDRDFARYSNIFRSQRMGAKAMNAEVLKVTREFMPEVVVLGHCKNIGNDTLAEIRKIAPGVKMIYRNVDPLSSPSNVAEIQQRVGHVEGLFITTAGDGLKQFAHPNSKIYFMPNPHDPAVENVCSLDNPNADIDFLFLGSVLRDQYDHRQDTARYLVDNAKDIKLHIGGAGVNEGRVYGAAFFALLNRAKMGLCQNKTADYYLYASGRMTQYMASGLLAFIPEGPQFEDVLGDDAFISFKTDEELLDKIRFYKQNDAERIRIARNGYERLRDRFHVDKVCQYMLDRVFDKPLSQNYAWPTTAY